MLKNKTLLKIFSLIAAILLWAYVVGEVDPDTTAKIGDIKVGFANADVLAEEELAAVSNRGMTVSAVIRGKRSRVNEVKRTGLSAYVNVSTCKEGKNSRQVVINAPEGVTVESESEEWLSFIVEPLVEEEKDMTIGFSEESGEADGPVPWVLDMSPDKVTVRGPESLVKQVSEVSGTIQADNVHAEDGDKWVYVSVVPVDKQGNKVREVIVEDSEHIQARIDMLESKEVPLDISIENVDSDMKAEIINAPEKIRIVGYDYTLDDIEDISGSVDMSGETDQGTHKIKVNLNLPDGIYVYDRASEPSVGVRLAPAE